MAYRPPKNCKTEKSCARKKTHAARSEGRVYKKNGSKCGRGYRKKGKTGSLCYIRPRAA